MQTILITGGTGFIGSYLARFLKTKGYTVALLSRTGKQSEEYPVFYWDIQKQIIDPKAILAADHIIHLAGENIGDKRWTEERKKAVIYSRILPARLLREALTKTERRPESIISASAIGFYGATTSDHIYAETDPPANDFLGHTCRQWENEVNKFAELGIRTVKLRTGVVLGNGGGALEKMKKPVAHGMAFALGSGSQYMPWIHIDDLCAMYLYAIENKSIAGTYNAVAPQHTTNREFMETLAATMHKPISPVSVPSFMLKLAMGEMAELLLQGSRVSAEKIMSAGFQFEYTALHKALDNLIL